MRMRLFKNQEPLHVQGCLNDSALRQRYELAFYIEDTNNKKFTEEENIRKLLNNNNQLKADEIVPSIHLHDRSHMYD